MLLGSGGARSMEMAILDFVATRVREMQVGRYRRGDVGVDSCGAIVIVFVQLGNDKEVAAKHWGGTTEYSGALCDTALRRS